MDYMPVDPMAPADSPLHPSQVAKARQGELVRDPADVEREALQALVTKHRTAAEVEAQQMPDRAELDRREELAASGGEAAELVDLTGAAHRWAVADENFGEGTGGFWQPAPPEPPEPTVEPATQVPSEPTPPATGDKTPADLNAALAALDAAKGKHA